MCEHEGHGSCHGAIEIPGIYGLGSINIVETWKKSELQKFQVICSECVCVCVNHLNRCKTSNLADHSWFSLLCNFPSKGFIPMNFQAGGLVVIASTSPTKRLAIDTDISGDAH